MRTWMVAMLLAVSASPPIFAQPPAPAAASAARQVSFDIPGENLNDALLTFADTCGVQLLYDTSIVDGLQSHAVQGKLPPRAALTRMLKGTGLAYRFTDDNRVSLVKVPPSLGGNALMTLSSVTVRARSGLENPYGPGAGYVTHQSVTATKTDTPLLETPQAISVVGREQMQAQDVQSLVGALRYTPSVQGGTDPVDNRFDSIEIRGFQPTLFLDGLALPFGASMFGRPSIDPFGLERVEVLRGPSSALYGEVPPGGLVNMISLRPPSDPVHMVQVQGNNFGLFQGGVDVGGPIDKDGTMLYRLSGLVHGGGTQIDHVDDHRIMIAPALTWRPDADTSLTFLSQYQRDHSGVEIQFLPAQGTLLPNPNGTIPVGRFLGEPGFDAFKRRQYWLGYEFSHRFDDTWSVRQNFRYANINTDLQAVIGSGLQADLRTLNRNVFVVPEKSQNVTLDNQAQADFQTGSLTHTVLLGVDYQWSDSRFRQGFGSAPMLDVFDPVYGAPITAPAFSVHTGQNQDQIGIYVQDQIALYHWRLTLSGRHDWVDTSTRNFVASSREDQDDDAFSGRAGLNYVFDIGLSPYISVARSFQPVTGVAADGAPFKPSSGLQYEAGLKYQPVDLPLTVNAAVFYLNQQNVLTADPDPAHIGFSLQTGKERVGGIELEANASLAQGLNLTSSYTYTDATNARGANAGKRIITVPHNQASLWMDYTVQGGGFHGFGLGGGVRYFGDTYGNATNTLRIPDYTLVDASLHYDLGAVASSLRGGRLMVNADNLLDRRHVATCTSLSGCYYGAARLVQVSLSYRW